MGWIDILTGLERRRGWTGEDKVRIVEEVETSGSGVAEIAGRHTTYSHSRLTCPSRMRRARRIELRQQRRSQ